MGDEHKNSTQNSHDEPSIINRSADFLAYPLALGSGLFTFVSSVNDKLYDTLKGLGKLPEVEKNRADFKTSNSSISAIAEKLPKFHSTNTSTYNTKLKEMGFDGFTKKLRGIHTNQLIDSAMIGLTFATVTLGAMLTIANSKSFMNTVESKEKEKKPDTQASR